MDLGEKTCANCNWWRDHLYQEPSDIRHCKRRAPTYQQGHMIGNQTVEWLNENTPRWNLTSVWPTTKSTDACGDWELLR